MFTFLLVGKIASVKPEKAARIEQMIIQNAQMGKI